MGRDICSVIACGKSGDGSSQLHQIPNDPFVADLWIRFLKLANQKYRGWQTTVRMSVCDDHFQYDAFVVSGTKRKLLRGKYPTLVPEGDISHQVVCEVGEKTESKHFKTSLCASGLAIEPSNLNILSQKVEESVFLINPPPPQERNQQFKRENADKTLMKRSDVLEMEIRELKEHNAALKVDNTNQRIEKDALNKRIKHLEFRVEELQKENHVLRQYRARVGKREAARQKKICEAQVESKKSANVNVASQTESIPSSQMELFLHDLVQRKEYNKNFPYTNILREVSFIIHYYSPVVYKYVRNLFENSLPHPCQFVRWTSFIDASPGLIAVSFNDIAKTNEVSKKYYSVSCDEMAIRTDIVFNRERLVGYVDGGGLTNVQDPSEHAKNAFFVVATEINGGKSIPIAYILTRGLRASQITEIMTKCLLAMHHAGGEVISITFDGLPANFKAMENMGANFELGTDKFKTFIEHPATNDKVYIMPDSSHMFKLVRNNFKACKILRNSRGDFINWGYIARLQEIQDIEGVRAANKLTKGHIQFEKQKMKTRLCVQALSHSVATAIEFCRKINVDGFKDSEATCEFLDICDKLFDMFNSRPRGMGLKTLMKISNSAIWSPFLNKAKSYLLTLECKSKDEYKPIYQTGKGTFVKGLVTSITSLQMIMVDIEEGKIILEYLPTYRQSQDPIEILFGKFRARLGFNNNPDVVQLEQALKATLSFSINACTTGNCIELDELSNKVCITRSLKTMTSECEDRIGTDEEEAVEATYALLQDLPSYENMSAFVENVVVYISGFVGRGLLKTLKCQYCKSSLIPENIEDMRLRSDFVLLNSKNRGGLFSPSEDLIKVCIVTEKNIRIYKAMGVSKLSSNRILNSVVQDCLERVFDNSYDDHKCAPISAYEKIGHRTDLVRAISKSYINIRLHHVAKLTSSELVGEKKRSYYNKLGHFSGY